MALKGIVIMDQEYKRKPSFLLRLPVSVREQATTMARDEGTSLNHFISLAVAEKISRMTSQPQSLKAPFGGFAEPVHAGFRNMRFQRPPERVA